MKKYPRKLAAEHIAQEYVSSVEPGEQPNFKNFLKWVHSKFPNLSEQLTIVKAFHRFQTIY